MRTIPSPSPNVRAELVEGPLAERAAARASFRDPGGVLIRRGGKILRAVNETALPDLEAFLALPLSEQLVREGKLVATRRVAKPESALAPCDLDNAEDAHVYEHDRVDFPSYPYEWPPEMLYEAGALTLELAARLLGHGFGLKDASPFNVLYRGVSPVFVDLLSFEQRDPRDATWRPYAQFVTAFLLPLLAEQQLGLSLRRAFAGSPNGIEPGEVYGMTGVGRRLRPPFLGLVSVPVWLSGKAGKRDPKLYAARRESSSEKASFILGATLKQLRRSLAGLEPRSGRQSVWSGYMNDLPYSDSAFEAKRAVLESALRTAGSRRVLDLGCNTGFFSFLAARTGAAVVGLDTDAAAVGQVWRTARSEHLNVLPLVVDFANPSAAAGWHNGEQLSFLERARGSFDTVLGLGLLHHLLVTHRIPLRAILTLMAELTTKLVIIEYVPVADANFVAIARGRDDLHRDFTAAFFEAECNRQFTILQAADIVDSGRRMYVLTKRT